MGPLQRAKGMASSRRGRATIAVCLSALLGGLAVVIVTTGSGARSDAVDLSAGSAWFASRPTGSVALIDGATGNRITRVASAADPDARIDLAQAGSSAIVADQSGHVVRRVDGADWSVSAPVPAGAEGDPDVVIRADESSIWVISKRVIAQERRGRDLHTVGDGLRAPGEITGAVLTDATLWLTDATGAVRSFRDGRARTQAESSGMRGATLIRASGTPVLVDPVTDSARVVDEATGTPGARIRFDWPSDGDPVLADEVVSKRWVVAIDPPTGTVSVLDLRSGRQREFDLGVRGDDRYGVPVEKDGWIYVPDRIDSTVIVVDPSSRPDRAVKARIALQLDGSPFQLLAQGRRVFYDETDGTRMGIITDDLTATSVSKDDESEGADQAEDVESTTPIDLELLECRASPATVQVGKTVTFIASRTDGGEDPDDATWSVADGRPTSGDGMTFETEFAAEGTFAVDLTATIGGVPLSTRCSVVVGELDRATSTGSSIVGPTDPDGTTTTTTVAKDSGGGGGRTTTTSTTTSTASTTSTTSTTTTAPPATLTFDWLPPSPSAGEPVTFTNRTAAGPAVSGWTFEGGPSDNNLESPTVSWPSPGNYNVTMIMADGRRTTNNVTIAPAAPNFMQIGSGTSHTCALRDDGTVWCWGDNSVGQLGLPAGGSSDTLVQVGSLSGVESITAGGFHTCAIRATGAELWCWGRGRAGELGNGASLDSATPVQVTGLPSPVRKASAGGFHTCAIAGVGIPNIYCWGSSTEGQLGPSVPVGAFRDTPQLVTSNDPIDLEAGYQHTCQSQDDGDIYCWGDNAHQQANAQSAPARVTAPAIPASVGYIRGMASGYAHTCVFVPAIFCWGWNVTGQAGTSNVGSDSGVSQILIGGSSIVGTTGIAAGYSHTCALINSAVSCWGSGNLGQLGNAGTADSSTPVSVVGLSAPAQISAQDTMTCVLDAAQDIWCWGRGYGPAGFAPYLVPIRIG